MEEIKLKNGEILELDWNSLIFEYLEDYDGGILGLKKDVNEGKNIMIVGNYIVYSVICANYDKELTYRQAIALVHVNDVLKIMNFVIRNVEEMEKDSDNTVDNKKITKLQKHRY